MLMQQIKSTKLLGVQKVKHSGGLWEGICSIKFGDEILQKSMLEGISLEVGNGSQIRFREDIWLEVGG